MPKISHTTTLHPSAQTEVVIITGMSGAGKSVALKALEDIGFEAIDNIPLSILPLLVQESSVAGKRLGIGLDIRNRDFATGLLHQNLLSLKNQTDFKLEVVFLDAEEETLRRRFTETRRRHPLAQDRPVTDGIHHERDLLTDIAQFADVVVDTSDFTAQDLRFWVQQRFTAQGQQMAIVIRSFAFRSGIPREADMVLDVRFLRNPHYVPALEPFTGQHKEVAAYIAQDPVYQPFIDQALGMLKLLLPRYQQEGKSYFTLAIGCTGGKHRSVRVAEHLAELLEKEGYKGMLRHRDMPNAI